MSIAACAVCAFSLAATPAIARPASGTPRAAARPATAASSQRVLGAMNTDIPTAVALPSSPVTGTLNDTTVNTSNNDAVYSVYLNANDVLSLALQLSPSVESSSANLELNLFGPGAASVLTSTPVKRGSYTGFARGYYPERMVFVAPVSGTYFVHVWDYAGPSVDYSLSWATWAAGPDDVAPGVALGASPVSGTFDALTDPDDFYSVTLADNEQLQATVTTTQSADLDLAVWNSAHPVTDNPVGSALAWDASAASTATIYCDRLPGDPAEQWLQVGAWSGAGTYELAWRVLHTPGFTLSLSTAYPTAYNAGISASGVVTDRFASVPVPGMPVTLWTSANGTSFKSVATTTTDGLGAYAFSARPTVKTWYRVSIDGDSVVGRGVSTQTVTVLPKAYLSTPYAPTTAYKGRAFSSFGYIKPRHTAGAQSVKLQCYRLERQSSGAWVWVLRKTVSAKNADYSSYTKFSVSTSLPSTGKWRIRAAHADAGHASSTSAFRYVTVR